MSTSAIVVPVFGVLALRIAFLVGVLVYGLFRSRYALIIETSGTEFIALSGRDPHELERIQREITYAIENPPDSEKVLHMSGDIVIGNQYKQPGHHNTMVVNQSDGISRAELDAAVAELRSFVAQLTSEGVVASDGSVTDPSAVVAAVESRPGGLTALGRAVAGGAKEAVLSVVKDGVARLIVALLDRA